MSRIMVNPANVAALMVRDVAQGEIKLELLMTGGQVLEVEGDEARDAIGELERHLVHLSGDR